MQNGPLFNFVVDLPESELAACAAAPDLTTLIAARPEMLARISSKGNLCWCLQSYLILKPRGRLEVHLSNQLAPNGINIVHSDHLLNLHGTADDFIVCIRADFPRRRWAHYHLVQNRAQLAAETTCLPLWPQPAQIGRDASREGVTTVAYAGEITNGNLASDTQAWQRLFAPHGLNFVHLPSHAWHDLSAIDAILGIRSFDRRRYDGKPPSKMLNAWHAGIPFIGGYDSAFAQFGTPGSDYLRAGSAEEVLQAVLRLRDNPLLYSLLVRNGRRRAAEFTVHAIAALWEQVLLGPVCRRHARWQTQRLYESARFRLLLALGLAGHGGRQAIKSRLRSVKAARAHRDAMLVGPESGRD
jgi:hypothetical protein